MRGHQDPERPIEFGALDLARDPERYAALAARIRRRVGPEVARRATRGDVLAGLGAWFRPAVGMSALAAAASLVLLMRDAETGTVGIGVVATPAAEPAETPALLGLPQPAARWVDGGEPTRADLITAVEEGLP